MKKTVLLFLSIIFFTIAVYAQTITVASFNVRYINNNDSGNLWKDRVKPVTDLVRFHDFDIMGTQEARIEQLKDMSAALPEYTRYGIGRDDGKEAGEHSAIYFKTDKFDLLKSGDFWLSETPDKPGKGWDATCCNRICSWVYLKEKKSGKSFYVFNVHFDHQGKMARVESGKLMLEKIRAIAKNTQSIVTGDFNGNRDSDWYLRLANSDILHDSYNDVKFPYEPNGSFNSFGKSLNSKEVIDHIFLTKNLKANKWGILTDTYHGKFPSDHYPVLVTVNL